MLACVFKKNKKMVCTCTKPKIAGVYIVAIFEVSVYIKKYKKKKEEKKSQTRK